MVAPQTEQAGPAARHEIPARPDSAIASKKSSAGSLERRVAGRRGDRFGEGADLIG
jgi:hypothetical protein